MQENNFEKQVRQKLDELHLTPTEPVWQRVEAAIKKKKERRLVFWLLPVLLLAGGLVWWQGSWHAEKVDAPQAQQSHQPAPAQQPTFSNPHTESPARDAGVQVPIVKQKAIRNEQKQTPVADQTQTPKDVLERAHATAKSTRATPPTRQVEPEPKQEPGTITFQAPSAIKQNSNVNSSINRTAAHPLNPMDSTRSNASQKPVQADVAVLPEPNPLSVSDSITKAAPEKDSLQNVVPVVQVQLKSKWRLRVMGRMGASTIREDLFSLSMAKSISADDAPLGGLPNQYNQDCAPCVTSGASAPQSSQPATPARGIQFTTGVQARRELSTRTFLITGLQYSFYSTRLFVGAEVSAASLNGFEFAGRRMFRNNGVQNQFTNRFHLVELPLGLEHRLLKKHPLHLQYGLTLNQLLASRVLQYDGRTNMYHQSNVGIRKTGVGFFAAAHYTLLSGKVASLQAGPYLQYSASNVFKNTTGAHLASAGLAGYVSF